MSKDSEKPKFPNPPSKPPAKIQPPPPPIQLEPPTAPGESENPHSELEVVEMKTIKVDYSRSYRAKQRGNSEDKSSSKIQVNPAIFVRPTESISVSEYISNAEYVPNPETLKEPASVTSSITVPSSVSIKVHSSDKNLTSLSIPIPKPELSPIIVANPGPLRDAPIIPQKIELLKQSTLSFDAENTKETRHIIRMPELGPLNTFMRDPKITEIMINDVRNVMIEKEGEMKYSGFAYQTIDELNRLVRNILDASGKTLNIDNPYIDLILPDGSRVNIIGPPLTILGPSITIRKFPAQKLTVDNLLALGTIDQRVAYFLNMCVLGELNILISGGTGSGKTTLLNLLESFIPQGERIVIIEDTVELTTSHSNSVRLQTKSKTNSSAAVTARDLVANSLRMRPDRIIIGECRKAEAFDMLQALNTGHSGSMTTIHANSTRDSLHKLETLCILAGTSLPITAIRKQITSAIQLIVHIKRFRNGKRRIVSITEVTGMDRNIITLRDIFLLENDAIRDGKKETASFKATGFVPTFIERLKERGINLPRNYFGL